MPIFRFRNKGRKYPIKKDEYGRSARKRAFAAFNSGARPADVASEVGISLQTACRYFSDWKKLPKNVGYTVVNQRNGTLFKPNTLA